MPKKVVYSGISVVTTDNLVGFFATGSIPLSELSRKAYFPNENLVIKAGKSSALAIVKGKEAIRVAELSAHGLTPRNKEQTLALNMLMDPTIVCVTLTGAAGTGKTLLSVAAALQQAKGAEAAYRKIIYIRNVHTVGKELGFLPGNLEDKVGPLMGPLYDCASFLKGDEKLIGWEDNSKIQMLASAFVRGRTFRRSFVIVDEVQNMTTHELKTILTRLDENSKIVLLGDIDQADVRLKPEDDGLVKVVEAFKDESMFGSIDLIKSERSKLAQVVAEKL